MRERGRLKRTHHYVPENRIKDWKLGEVEGLVALTGIEPVFED
jgi:hypothetical protein